LSRFTVRGTKRLVFDLASEGVTLGVGGAVVMLILAQPAFKRRRITSE
jgi:penicillin-binding protein 1A